MRLITLTSSHRVQRGMSLVELMIGIVIGMIVVAGASLLMTNQVREHGLLMQETQIQQDLRATADLMLRDMRRAGFWARAENAVWMPGDTVLPSNVYSPIHGDAEASTVTYAYSRANDQNRLSSSTENNNVDNNEAFGFRLENQTLQSLLGGTWQPLTDRDMLRITAFQVSPIEQTVPLSDYCNPPCPSTNPDCPSLKVRRVDITITGSSTRDASVVRTVRLSSRMRNDEIVGACPAPSP